MAAYVKFPPLARPTVAGGPLDTVHVGYALEGSADEAALGHPRRRAFQIALGSVSFLLLFAGFQWNLWRAAEPSSFAWHQKDTEALVIGRMVWSRQRGLFASAGLLGFLGTGAGLVAFDTNEMWAPESFTFQARTYLEGIPIRSFSPYLSHSGLQGAGFSTLDRILSAASPVFKVGLFRSLTAVLVAAAYALLILWLSREFGIGVALFSLLVMLASPWLTVFARNLYWSLWLFLLPTLAIGAVLSARSEAASGSRRLPIVAFVTLLIRFLAGYEFATLSLAMAVAPVLYYSIRNTWPRRVLLRRLGVLVGAALAALIVSIAFLTLQIAVVTGSPRNAADHFRFAIGRRTSGDPSRFPPAYAKALRATVSDVLETYIPDRFDRLDDSQRRAPSGWLLSRRYGELILWVLLAAVWAAGRTARLPAERRFRPIALAAAVLCALSGTLAWLVIFKAHSFIHVHVNPLMWHLFFLPLGAGLVFFALQDAALLLGRTVGLFAARRTGSASS